MAQRFLQDLNRLRSAGRALQEVVERLHDKVALSFLGNGEDVTESLDYARLDARARSVGMQLAARGTRGLPVLVCCEPGPDFVAAFLGVVHAGAIAVPVPVPRFPGQAARVEAIMRDAHVAAVVARSSEHLRIDPSVAVISPDVQVDPGGWQPTPTSDEDLVMLQYTSGSTGTPKGVRISHRNLLANSELLRRTLAYDADSISLTWLPPSHDMGLIEGLLQPLLHGTECMVMTPEAFLRRPLRWVRAISRYGVSHSGGPTFAYEACAERSREAEATLDLARWRLAYVGAEPIRHAVLDRFAQAFGPHGFRRACFRASYGMAEATLLVSDGPATLLHLDPAALARHEVARLAPGTPGARVLVRCGKPHPEMEVLIFDADSGQPVPADAVGEICIRGASVTQGYWNGGGAPEGPFHEAPGGRFLRTGDLGFLDDGHVVVTGRAKDMLIVRGRNLNPQDIETLVRQAVPGMRRMPVVFGTFGLGAEEQDRLVVAYEHRGQDSSAFDETVRSIRRVVAEQIEVECATVLALAAGEIHHTTSGKVMRSELRQRYAAGSLHIVHQWQREDRAAWPQADAGLGDTDPLLQWLVQRLGLQARERQARMAELGADSLFAVELAQWLEQNCGHSVASARLLRMSVGELLDLAATAAPAPAPSAAAAAGAAAVAGIVANAAQEGLHFLHRYWGDRDPFVLTVAARITGDADSSRLLGALRALVLRHPMLRSRFPDRAALPGDVSSNLRFVPVPDPSTRVQLVDDPAGDHFARELARAAAAELGENLFQARAFRTDGDGLLLLLRVHHVAADFWSLRLALSEIAQAYAGGMTGGAGGAAPAEATVAPVVARNAGDAANATRRLRGASLAFGLPTDHQRPAQPSFRGGRQSRSLEPDLAHALRVCAQSKGLTLATTLLACFVGLCSRQAGSEDILVGVPSDCRSAPASEPLIAMQSQTLLVRVELSGQVSGDELLLKTDAALHEALLGGPVAMDRLLRELDVRASPDLPVPRLLFNFLSTGRSDAAALGALAAGLPGPALPMAGLVIEPLETPAAAAFHDLTLHVVADGEALQIVAHYAADLFRGERVARLLAQYERLLEALCRTPQMPLRRIDIVAPAEKQQLERYAGSCADRAPAVTLHALFEQQAQRTPDAPAVIAADAQLSYRELDGAADRLAARLLGNGVRAGDRVGIHLPRGSPLLTAILAVLKCGAAYVPMDPRYPAERLRAMQEDSRARVVVAAGAVPWLQGVEAVDPSNAPAGETASARVRPAVPADAAAYVLFTSGTTGRPKGVVIAHRSAAGLVHWAKKQFGDALDRVFASTSASFDLSVFEMFSPLARGGTVIIGESLLELPERASLRPTLASGVPSVFAALLERGPLPPLRALAVAGEALSAELAERLLSASPGVRLFDLYGPTEVTTYATGIERRRGDHATIGRALPWTRCYVLDQAQEATPIGVPGEIWLGGDRLACGYVGRPGWTADRFRPDPYATRPGSLMYRTGDRGHFRPDGLLVYGGRLDRQIKLRGFRIEQVEIEAVLQAYDGVAQAAVAVLPGNRSSGEHLVAWIAPADVADERQMREHVAARLPGFMVPSAFHFLEALPVTPNGKLDRDELLRLAGAAVPRSVAGPPGADPLVERVAAVMARVLGQPGVAPDDSFFEQGGHSIDAVRAGQALKETFGIDLPLRELFDNDTPQALAARLAARGITHATPPGGDAAAPALADVPTPLSFLQRQIWFDHCRDPGSAVWHVPLRVRLSRPLNASSAQFALDRLQHRHSVLRTRLVAGDEPLQQVWSAAPAAVVEIDGPEPSSWVRRPFDLGQQPPLRVRLDHEEGLAVLLFNAHHLLIDGASLGLLVREFLQLAGEREDWGVAAMAPPVEPAVTAPIPDPLLAKRDRRYWAATLSGAKGTRWEGRAGRVGPAASGGGVSTLTVPQSLGRGVARLARELRATPFMVLMAGFFVALARWNRSCDISIATPVSLAQSGASAAGMHVQPVILRLQMAADWPFRQVVTRLRSTLGDALQHAGLPFQEVVGAFGRSRAYADPFYRILFASQDSLPRRLTVGSVEAQCTALPTGHARCDLTVLVHGADADDMLCAIEYREALYEPADIGRLTDHWLAVLQAVVDDPGLRLDADELPASPADALTDARREELAEPAAATAAAPPTAEQAEDDALAAGVAAAWAEVLGSPPPRDRSFFACGGNSLLALRLIGQIQHTTGVRLSLKDFLATQDVVELAQVVRHRQMNPLPPTLPDLPRRVADQGTSPVTVAQQQLLFFEEFHPGTPTYHVGVAAALEGELDAERLAAAVAAVTARHRALRLQFERSGGAFRQWVRPVDPAPSSAGLVRLEAAGLEQAREAASAFLVRPFVLTREPPFRAALIAFGTQRHLLVLGAHHVAVDAQSQEILLDEIGLAYRGTPLAPVPAISAPEFAAWERSWLDGEIAAQCASHWARRLQNATPALGLPFLPGAATGGGTVERVLDATRLAALRGAASRHGASLLHLVLAAYACMLGQQSGSNRFVIGLPIGTRRGPQMDRVVGFFSNTVPVRVDLQGALDVRALLGAIRDEVADAHEWGWLPLPRILDAWRPPRDPQRPAFFQAMFVLQDGEPPDIFPGRTHAVSLDLGHPRCDLLVAARAGSSGLVLQLQHTASPDAALPARCADALLEALLALAADRMPALQGRPALAEPLATGAPRPAAAGGPDRQALATGIAGIWREVLGTPRLDEDRTFFEHGGSSLQLVEVQSRLQALVGREVRLSQLFSLPRISELTAALLDPAEFAAAQPAAAPAAPRRHRRAARSDAVTASRVLDQSSKESSP